MEGLFDLIENSVKPFDLLIVAYNSIHLSELSNEELVQYKNMMDNGYTKCLRERSKRGL